ADRLIVGQHVKRLLRSKLELHGFGRALVGGGGEPGPFFFVVDGVVLDENRQLFLRVVLQEKIPGVELLARRGFLLDRLGLFGRRRVGARRIGRRSARAVVADGGRGVCLLSRGRLLGAWLFGAGLFAWRLTGRRSRLRGIAARVGSVQALLALVIVLQALG